MHTNRLQTSELLVAIGGPAVTGVLLTLPYGLADTARGAATLPAIIIGVLTMMAPALYIAASLAKVELSLRTILDASAAALSRTGLVLLGLAPALLFLHASTTAVDSGVVGASLSLVVAVVVGAKALFPLLFAERHTLNRVLFTCWLVVGLSIAASLYVHAFLK